MMKKLCKTVLICSTLLTGCTASQPVEEEKPTVQTWSNVSVDAGFDTIFSMSQTSSDKTVFDENFNEAVELFHYYNDLFDIYNNYDGVNNIKTINDNAGIQPVTVDQGILDLLAEAKHYYDLSNGEFDITAGNLLQVWHRYRQDGIDANTDEKLGKIPTKEELEEASQYKGWQHIIIDEDARTVYIDDENISLDVGGIAKGFAAERIGRAMEEKNQSALAINAGGNNRTVGMKYNGSDWRVGIQNPDDQGSLLVVSKPGSMSFVTSGDYERFYVGEDGQRYSHIIDPATLYPAVYYRSVSIITQDSGIADCLSTTLFTLSYEDGLEVIETFKQEHPDMTLDVIWIMDPAKNVNAKNSALIGNYYVCWTDGLNDQLEW